MSAHPPHLAVWLLSRRVPVEWRDFILGDSKKSRLDPLKVLRES